MDIKLEIQTSFSSDGIITTCKLPLFLYKVILGFRYSQSRFPSLDVQIPTYYVTRSTNVRRITSSPRLLVALPSPSPRNLPPTISSRWNRARRTFPHFRRTSLSMAPRIPKVENDPSPAIIRRRDGPHLPRRSQRGGEGQGAGAACDI